LQDFFLNHPNNKIIPSISTEVLANSNSMNFHTNLKDYNCTPFISLKSLAKELKINNLFVKDESQRFGLNAFKVLGASYAVYELLNTDSDITTFCTATDGNHGRAVAWSARKENIKCVVYVPEGTTNLRINAISKEGAEVYKLKMNYEKTCDYAEKMSLKNNWTLIQDTSWDNYEEIPALIMSGYLTHFHELENQMKLNFNSKIDIVFLQCGVGSWPASCIWYFLNKYRSDRPKIVIVEPQESAGVFESFNLDYRSSPNGNYKTIMAGLNCGIPSKNGWDLIKNGCDASIIISDDYAIKAMNKYYYPSDNDVRIISGESGAAGLAGLLKVISDSTFDRLRKHINLNTSSNVLLFNTEGATDINDFNKIIKLN
jgi:diaminopropionate ammonia-lyase